MLVKIMARCQRVQVNNGITQAFFTGAAEMADHESQESHVLLNVKTQTDQFVKGADYLFTVERMGPR